MDKKSGVYSQNGMTIFNKKEQATDIHCTKDDSQE